MTKRLKDMTWEEAREALETNRLGIIPTGSIEQHGPHLPLGTDFLIADCLAKRVSEKTDAIVTPAFSDTLILPSWPERSPRRNRGGLCRLAERAGGAGSSPSSSRSVRPWPTPTPAA